MLNPQWVGDDRLAAGTEDFTKLMVFDVRAQQWSELVSFTAPGNVVDWVHTPEHRSVDYITGGADPMLFRVRLADRKIETITSLKGMHRATGSFVLLVRSPTWGMFMADSAGVTKRGAFSENSSNSARKVMLHRSPSR